MFFWMDILSERNLHHWRSRIKTQRLKLFCLSPMMDYLKVSGKHENFDQSSTISIMLFSFDVKCFFGWIYFQRERNSSMSPVSSKYLSSSPRQNNGKANGRHRTTSSPHPLTTSSNSYTTINNGQKEKGIIEKLLPSYGFVECASTSYRVFFHYSEFEGDPNDLAVGGW